MTDKNGQLPFGRLAAETGKLLPLQICESQAGFYIGTLDEEGLPYSRESNEYWRNRVAGERALATKGWTQKLTP